VSWPIIGEGQLTDDVGQFTPIAIDKRRLARSPAEGSTGPRFMHRGPSSTDGSQIYRIFES
jgi:hypothetical protein